MGCGVCVWGGANYFSFLLALFLFCPKPFFTHAAVCQKEEVNCVNSVEGASPSPLWTEPSFLPRHYTNHYLGYFETNISTHRTSGSPPVLTGPQNHHDWRSPPHQSSHLPEGLIHACAQPHECPPPPSRLFASWFKTLLIHLQV